MGSTKYGINMNDCEMGFIGIELWLNQPHAGILFSIQVNARKPMDEGALVLLSLKEK
jgi:hypothetical protein